jgi:hypothetical protein
VAFLRRFGPQDGLFDTLVLPQVDTPCMQLFLDEVAACHGDDNTIMVLDGADWHTRNVPLLNSEWVLLSQVEHRSRELG